MIGCNNRRFVRGLEALIARGLNGHVNIRSRYLNSLEPKYIYMIE